MIAGIDLSTHAVDVVLVNERDPEWWRFNLRGNDAFDRARYGPEPALQGWLNWSEIEAVGIEDPRGYGAGSIYRVQGAVLACVPLPLLVQPWVPSQWRKAVGLKGNATKEDVRAFVENLVPVATSWPQDACDAFCIAEATRLALASSA